MSVPLQKRIAESHAYLAEIVGSENLSGQRMQAGAILDLMDVVAGQAAIRHAKSAVVTLSFDRVDLVHPIVHLNLVRLDGRVVEVGRSSMIVAVNVTRQDPVTREFIPIQHSYVTMVAIDAERRPNRNIPGLALENDEDRTRNADALEQKSLSAQWVRMQESARRERTLSVHQVEDPLNREKREFLLQHSYVTMMAIDAERRPNRNIPGLALENDEDRTRNADALEQKSLSAQWVRMQEGARQVRTLSVHQVEDPLNREKREFLLPEETAVRVRRMFMPRNLNVLGTIFGGDILLWMDRVATYTARLFTRNTHMVTLAMNRIFFKQPIFATDLVEMTARVVYVRRFTLEVEIEVTLQGPERDEVSSHSGYFTVLNYDESGFKRPIVTGLRLDDADQENLMRYHLARLRNRFWQEHRGALAR